MAYYLDLYSPDTYETFSATDRSITGFRKRQLHMAQKVSPGDKLICYMTKLGRWVGILEVTSPCYVDDTERIFYKHNDPFVVRFKVKPVIWLEKEKALPIRESVVWDALSFTKGVAKNSSSWTGKLRASLTPISESDGKLLETLLVEQNLKGQIYKVDEEEYRKYLTQEVQGPDNPVTVAIPIAREDEGDTDKESVRESIQIQALLAEIGDKMGYTIWIPKNDRSRVLKEWKDGAGKMPDKLPISTDLATLGTIEQIDVLWLKRRSIVRAFEVEHTTAVYSGLLRMADLLALQPNMDIKLHIVAPEVRKDKVFDEIRRPVFSLLERGPMAETCTFISYDSLKELAKQKLLTHLTDSVLEEYEDLAE